MGGGGDIIANGSAARIEGAEAVVCMYIADIAGVVGSKKASSNL
jgi:hypothetical protein